MCLCKLYLSDVRLCVYMYIYIYTELHDCIMNCLMYHAHADRKGEDGKKASWLAAICSSSQPDQMSPETKKCSWNYFQLTIVKDKHIRESLHASVHAYIELYI